MKSIIARVFGLLSLALLFGACATESNFHGLYNYYFPKKSDDARAVYRKSFDERLFGRPPVTFATPRGRELYYAFHGNPAAFHAFQHNRDKYVNGAQGEEWDYECVVLLLRLGDDRFSELLAREGQKTRDEAAGALEPLIDWNKHHFPKTRALYRWRKIPSSGTLKRVPLGQP